MRKQLFFILVTMLNLLLTSPKATAADEPKSNETRVRDYVAAYNAKDLDGMLSMVTDDIQWLSVDGDKVAVETKGKDQLRESMAAYFKSAPSAKSELEWIQLTRSRAAALERASWQTKNGKKSQTSLSVYEFRRGLIARVYYYPAEK